MTSVLPHLHRRRPPYIGDSDQDILAFISNLARAITQHRPGAYGLTADDLAIIVAARDKYEPLFQACATNDRTRSLVVAKDQARDEADHIGRRYAQIIKNMPPDKVSDQLKAIAGVPISGARKRRKSHVAPPSSYPRLYLHERTAQGLTQLVRSVWLRFRDSALTGTARMPREKYVTHMVLHAEIVAFGSDGVLKPRFSMDERSLRVVGYVTRNPYRVKLDASLLAKFGIDIADPSLHSIGIMFRSQWLNARGLAGELGPARFVNVVMKGASAVSTHRETNSEETLKLAA
jgi:hypothetical protein